MKVNEGQGAPKPVGKAESSAPAEPKKKPFDRVLKEKSAAQIADPRDAIAALLLNQPGPSLAPVDAKPAAAGPDAVALQQLVQEIVAVAHPDGRHSVDIQFDSRVLEGLQVHIAGDPRGVSIRFNAASDQVAALLTPNIDALAQALEAKGMRVAAIDVQSPAKRESGNMRRNQQQGGGRNRS